MKKKKINNLTKFALITGVTGDIGKAIVKNFLENNIHVVGISKSEQKQKKLLSELKKYKNNIDLINIDLEKVNLLEQKLKKIKNKFGIPNFIIHCAGIFKHKNLEKHTNREIIEIFNLNVLSSIFISKYFINDLKKARKGKIINICSSSAYNGGGNYGHSIYSSTKHALLGFSRGLDEEVRELNIRIGTVSPAGVTGKMTNNRTDIVKSSLMEPKEVANAVDYLIKADGKGIIYEIRIWRMNR